MKFSSPVSRLGAWAGGSVLLSAALLVGCGGGGGGRSTPPQPKVVNSVWQGTLTPTGGGAAQTIVGAVLADDDSHGTIRLMTFPDAGSTVGPYQGSGAFTFDPANGATDGTVTVYAPDGQTFGDSQTTSCTFTGTLAGQHMEGDLQGAFGGHLVLDVHQEPGFTLADLQGRWANQFPHLSVNGGAILTFSDTGTFTGISITLAGAQTGTFDNGTLQFVAGSRQIARVAFTKNDTGGTLTNYSGLAVVGTLNGLRVMGILADGTLADNSRVGYQGVLASVPR